MPSSSSSIHNDMHGFLRRPAQYTILPTPLPADAADETHQHLFTDSPTQDRIAVMDACLHDLHDVPRAKEIFERLRESMRGDQLLDVRLYNHFLQAFFDMATRKESNNHAHWLEEAWILYNEMEAGREGVQPTANTYAIMLRMWLRFNPDSESPVQISAAEMHDPMSLLRNMLRGSVAPALVVADRAFTTSEEATEAIKALSRAAVEMGLSSVVNELGLADSHWRSCREQSKRVDRVLDIEARQRRKDEHEHEQRVQRWRTWRSRAEERRIGARARSASCERMRSFFLPLFVLALTLLLLFVSCASLPLNPCPVLLESVREPPADKVS